MPNTYSSPAWQDIAGYEGKYKVNAQGEVYSVSRVKLRNHAASGKLIKQYVDKDGHTYVFLCSGVGKDKARFRIQGLVAEAFPNK